MAGLLTLLTAVGLAQAQVVGVSLWWETNVVTLGSTTVLHVAAQVLPPHRDAADRIFSWYVDVMNHHSNLVSARYALLQKPASDNDPQISSAGLIDGAHCRGIYDTFMNLPGAGTTNPVVLLTVPVVAQAPGQATFEVRAGSGVTGLSTDFIVAPKGGGDPWLGGNYSNAVAVLTIVPPQARAWVDTLRVTPLPGGLQRAELRFPISVGYQVYVEFCDALTAHPAWQTLPGGPFAEGVAVDNNAPRNRFYRLRLERAF